MRKYHTICGNVIFQNTGPYKDLRSYIGGRVTLFQPGSVKFKIFLDKGEGEGSFHNVSPKPTCLQFSLFYLNKAAQKAKIKEEIIIDKYILDGLTSFRSQNTLGCLQNFSSHIYVNIFVFKIWKTHRSNISLHGCSQPKTRGGVEQEKLDFTSLKLVYFEKNRRISVVYECIFGQFQLN